jgi:hypothetical protein
MKKAILILLAILNTFLFNIPRAAAQNGATAATDEKYVANFRKAMANLDSAWSNPAKLRETANQFERLANYKKDDWLPRYYQALCLIQQSWTASNAAERETMLKGAETAIQTAAGVSKDNSEIVSLEGYLYQAMIMVNPMSNGAIYGPKSATTLQKAMQLDDKNPRPHYLLGQNIYHTPEMWGGGVEKAKPHLEKAKELFATFKPVSEFHPDWGAYINDMLLSGKMQKE